VFLGAVGGPQWETLPGDQRPERGLLALRKALGVYANIRPVAVFPTLADTSPLKADRIDGVDLVVVRELTGGIYFGEKILEDTGDGERASDTCVYTTLEIERVVRLAATLARRRRNRLVSVDKANVLETSRLWRRIVTHVMETEFPDVSYEHMLVDACAMHLIRRPADFDVIVTENMFGDILTDEASVIAGSIGLLPSASLSATEMGLGLYEPIHGSAPDIAGRGIANPIGSILSIAMLLRHSLGLEAEARTIETAVVSVVADGSLTADIADVHARTTSEVGSAIANCVEQCSPVGA
jgi:3-isopropylmalate dehydrogenase